MRLLVLDENYPHLDNLTGDVFVHVRIKEYIKKHEVQVFTYFQQPRELIYEGVSVQMFDDKQKLIEAIRSYNPDKILIHFFQSWMFEDIIKAFKIPFIIWVHGYEALGWYRRLFNYKWYALILFNYIYKNTLQQYRFRRLIRYANRTKRIEFVFVSKWMKRVAEVDTLIKIKKWHIIPNPIDVDLFHYRKAKEVDLRRKVLILRYFGTRKYANDISVKAIELLSKRPCFKEFSFTIIGRGELFEKTLAPIKHFPNVIIQNGAVRQIEIPAVHSEYGIFLCPTRQDAQGVSMCEAMSSGLVPVTSNNTAIPEFVTHRSSGYLTHNPKEIADILEQLYNEPEKFRKASEQAASSIRQLCNINVIAAKELNLIEN